MAICSAAPSSIILNTPLAEVDAAFAKHLHLVIQSPRVYADLYFKQRSKAGFSKLITT